MVRVYISKPLVLISLIDELKSDPLRLITKIPKATLSLPFCSYKEESPRQDDIKQSNFKSTGALKQKWNPPKHYPLHCDYKL